MGEFVKWYYVQTEWGEEHDYQTPMSAKWFCNSILALICSSVGASIPFIGGNVTFIS
jgi:hypothetical protein